MNQVFGRVLPAENFILYVEGDSCRAAAEAAADELEIDLMPKSSAVPSPPAICRWMRKAFLS